MLHRLLCLLCLCTLLAAEDDPVAKELTRYDEAVAKLQKSFDEGVVKERAKAVPALATLAKKQLAKGDMPGTVKAWKAVLKLDREHAEARQFFTSVNQLEQVLAELDKEDDGADLLGDGKGATPAGKPIDATAVIDATKPTLVGKIAAGSTISLQYRSGQWTFRRGVRPYQSPDAADALPQYHLCLIGPSGDVLAMVPAGTAATAFTYTATTDLAQVSLRIRQIGADPEGKVTYGVRVVPAK